MPAQQSRDDRETHAPQRECRVPCAHIARFAPNELHSSRAAVSATTSSRLAVHRALAPCRATPRAERA
eukprot:6072774-Pleurochrysis_carterae.AAC.1